MRDSHLTPQERTQTIQFADAMNRGSSIPSSPPCPFSDAEEMELAAKLLRVKSEADLERFLGDLLKSALRGVGPAGSKVIGPIGALLKTHAKVLLSSTATMARSSFGGPAGEAITEKHRRFVRLAGKVAQAAASAPGGVSPVAVARKILADSAKERPIGQSISPARAGKYREDAAAAAPKAAAPAGMFADGSPAAARAAKSPAAEPIMASRPRMVSQFRGRRSCTICGLPAGSCRCREIGLSGRWFRSGNSIIVNC
jgi:hypothetical protein